MRQPQVRPTDELRNRRGRRGYAGQRVAAESRLPSCCTEQERGRSRTAPDERLPTSKATSCEPAGHRTILSLPSEAPINVEVWLKRRTIHRAPRRKEAPMLIAALAGHPQSDPRLPILRALRAPRPLSMLGA